MKMNKTKLSTSLLLVSSAFLLAACGGGEDSTDTTDTGESTSGEGTAENLSDEQVLNLIETAEIPSLDTTQTTDTVSFTVLNNVNEGLYRQDVNNELVLGVAAEEPEVSEDGLTYTFTLREDSNWSNGDPVTADDFVYAWRKLVDPANAAPYSYMMDGVIANATEIMAEEADPEELGVTAIDEKTLEVQLETNVPYFKDLLTLAMYYPQNEAFVEEQGDQYALSSDALVYNGPFVLADWEAAGVNWTYEKNEDYWDAENVTLDTINVDVVKETSTALNLYDTDQIDRMSLTGEYVASRQGDADLISQPEATTFYLKYNQVRDGEETPLANENIRKAISMAFDKEAYATTILQDGSVPANGLVPEGLAADPTSGEDFRAENGDLLVYDVEQAQEYWEAGLEELGVEELSLGLLSGDTESAARSSEFLQSELQTNLPGLTISLRNVPFQVRLEEDNNQDYDIQLAGWGADYADPINFIELFVTDGGNNTSGYSNEEYDALVQSALTEVDDLETRWQNLLEAEQILLEEAGIGPIYQRSLAVLEKPSVNNIGVHVVGAEYSYKWAFVTE